MLMAWVLSSLPAAGNDNTDANNFYPANLNNVITMTASDNYNRKAYFPNYSNKIDITAPGMDILSARCRNATRYACWNRLYAAEWR